MNRPNSVLFLTSPETVEPTGCFSAKASHGFCRERDAALDRIDLEHLDVDLLARRDDLAGMDVLLGPGHFRDVDEALDPRLQLHEGAVVGDVGDAAVELGVDRIFRLDALPRILEQLLHAERDAVRLVIDLDDLHLDGLTDGQHLGRMIDAPPGDVGDMQQAVDAAQIHEGAVVGDVLHDAVDHLPLFEVGDDLVTLLGAALLEHGAAGDDDVAAAAVHFQDVERLRHVHQRADVADRTNVDLRARQEGHGAVEVDGEAALNLIEDDALDLLIGLEGLFELDPALFAPRLVARDHGLAQRVLDALEIDLDFLADGGGRIAAVAGEFLEGDAAFGLQTDVDDGDVLLDGDDAPLDDGTFEGLVIAIALFEQGGKIFARGRAIGRGGHFLSWGPRSGRRRHGLALREGRRRSERLAAQKRVSGRKAQVELAGAAR
jgi:hypothetical protein